METTFLDLSDSLHVSEYYCCTAVSDIISSCGVEPDQPALLVSQGYIINRLSKLLIKFPSAFGLVGKQKNKGEFYTGGSHWDLDLNMFSEE